MTKTKTEQPKKMFLLNVTHVDQPHQVVSFFSRDCISSFWPFLTSVQLFQNFEIP